MNESNVDKMSLHKKFFTYRKSPYIFNDIKDWIISLIILLLLGFILLKLSPYFNKF